MDRFGFFSLICLLAPLVVTLGCDSGGRPTYRVTGKVTWKGKPVPKGLIYFDPDVRKSNDGPQGYALISDGQFDTGIEGRNVAEGPHIVRVEGYDGQEGSELPLGRLIFTEYTFDKVLPAEPSKLDIEVPDVIPQKTAPEMVVP